MSARDQITTACGQYVGIAERGHTALSCLEAAGVTEARALPIVALQLSSEALDKAEQVRRAWRSASDFMPASDQAFVLNMQTTAERLRALVPTAKLHPVMAEALAPFLGLAA